MSHQNILVAALEQYLRYSVASQFGLATGGETCGL